MSLLYIYIDLSDEELAEHLRYLESGERPLAEPRCFEVALRGDLRRRPAHGPYHRQRASRASRSPSLSVQFLDAGPRIRRPRKQDPFDVTIVIIAIIISLTPRSGPIRLSVWWVRPASCKRWVVLWPMPPVADTPQPPCLACSSSATLTGTQSARTALSLGENSSGSATGTYEFSYLFQVVRAYSGSRLNLCSGADTIP